MIHTRPDRGRLLLCLVLGLSAGRTFGADAAGPAKVRQVIPAPVASADVKPPVTCNVPVADAICMTADRGAVIPLANHTLKPITRLELTVSVAKPIDRIESVHQGQIAFESRGDRGAGLTLPVESTDFVKIYYR